MSKSNEADLQRKEAIEKLKGERIELLEKLDTTDADTNEGRREINEKIAIIDDQIKTLQALNPSQV